MKKLLTSITGGSVTIRVEGKRIMSVKLSRGHADLFIEDAKPFKEMLL